MSGCEPEGKLTKTYLSGRGYRLSGATITLASAWFAQSIGALDTVAAFRPYAEGIQFATLLAFLACLTPAIGAVATGIKIGTIWLGYDALLGAGYAKSRPLIFFAILLGCGGWVYAQAADQGAIVPVSQTFLVNEQVRRSCAGPRQPAGLADKINWTKCAVSPHGMNTFQPYWYSLDLMLQFGPLGQRRDWEPASEAIGLVVPYYGHLPVGPSFLKTFSWLQSIVALGLYALLLGAITGLIKK